MSRLSVNEFDLKIYYSVFITCKNPCISSFEWWRHVFLLSHPKTCHVAMNVQQRKLGECYSVDSVSFNLFEMICINFHFDHNFNLSFVSIIFCRFPSTIREFTNKMSSINSFLDFFYNFIFWEDKKLDCVPMNAFGQFKTRPINQQKRRKKINFFYSFEQRFFALERIMTAFFFFSSRNNLNIINRNRLSWLRDRINRKCLRHEFVSTSAWNDSKVVVVDDLHRHCVVTF